MSEPAKMPPPKPEPKPWVSDEEHDAIAAEYLKRYSLVTIAEYDYSRSQYLNGHLCQCCGVMDIQYAGNRAVYPLDRHIASEFCGKATTPGDPKHETYETTFRIKDAAGDLIISWNDQ